MKYINNYCYCSTINEFIKQNRTTWIEIIKHNFKNVHPDNYSDEMVKSWETTFDVLNSELKKAVKENNAYGVLNIIFEYVLPNYVPEDIVKLDDQHGVRADVIILGKNKVCVLEFKNRKINDKNYKYITSQTKKYVHRLRHNHDASANMKITSVFVSTSMKNFNQIFDRVHCVSPDRINEVIPTIMGLKPEPYIDIYEWINSSYSKKEYKEKVISKNDDMNKERKDEISWNKTDEELKEIKEKYREERRKEKESDPNRKKSLIISVVIALIILLIFLFVYTFNFVYLFILIPIGLIWLKGIFK